MESLYDSLRIEKPGAKDDYVEPWYDKPLSPKAFSELVVNSPEFRRYIAAGIVSGQLPQAVMVRILDHAWGQPVKRIEVDKPVRSGERLTADQLKERLARLSSMVLELEQSTTDSQSEDESTDDDPSAVH